jgi:predicted transcriptional regulator
VSHDGNAQKDDPASRKRSRKAGLSTDTSGPDYSVPASSAPAPPTLFPFSLLFFGGYRRISKKNVLEHNARNVIYEAVAEQPGIEVKALAEMTGINENTLRYHLARLVATGKITCFIRPGVVRYFRNQGAFSRFEQVVFHYLWTDTPRGILWLLSRHPGLTRQQIADALAISGPSVTRQMEHLIEDRVVENQLSGRSNHYYLTEDATKAINQLRVRPPALALEAVGVRPISIPAG